jgi:hypothetical protein
MKIRRLALIEDGTLKYDQAVDLLLQGASSSDEILKAVRVTMDLDRAASSDEAEKFLDLDNETYQFLLSRIEKTGWNSPGDKKTRIALGKFITTLRTLPEVDAKIS